MFPNAWIFIPQFIPWCQLHDSVSSEQFLLIFSIPSIEVIYVWAPWFYREMQPSFLHWVNKYARSVAVGLLSLLCHCSEDDIKKVMKT